MGLFGGGSKKKLRQKNDKTVSYDDALRTGSSIGKLITNIGIHRKTPVRPTSLTEESIMVKLEYY